MASITSIPSGSVPDDFPAAGLFSTEHIQTPYGEYDVEVCYENNQGKLALPVAKAPGDPGPSLVIVRLHAPVCRKIVKWKATRHALQPLVPLAETGDPALSLLSDTYWPITPELMGDGITKIYGFAGVYVYACQNGVQASLGFALTFPPHMVDTGEAFNGGNFTPGIIG